MNIYLDGKLAESYEIHAEDLPKNISVNLKNALQMKLEIIGKGSKYGFANAVIK